MKNIYIVAHRGGKSSYKENTLDAFLFGLKHGANAVEMDVRFDHLFRRFYLEHDFFHFPWKNFNTMEKVIPNLPENTTMFIELKTLTLLRKKYAKHFLKMVDQYALNKRAVIISFNPFVLFHLKTHMPKLQIGFLVRHTWWWKQIKKWIYEFLRPQFLLVHCDLINQEILEFSKEREMDIVLFTANSVESWRKAKEMGVAGVITDYPSEAFEVLG